MAFVNDHEVEVSQRGSLTQPQRRRARGLEAASPSFLVCAFFFRSSARAPGSEATSPSSLPIAPPAMERKNALRAAQSPICLDARRGGSV